MPAPHPAELIQAVRRFAAQGCSDREIGDKLGLTKAAVDKIRRNHGIAPGKTISVPPEVVKVIRAMAAEWASDAAIGRAVGMSKAAVWAARKRHGIQKDAVRYASTRSGMQVVRPREHHAHGALSMYNSGCRCDGCRTANGERARANRARRIERFQRGEVEIQHGRSGYTNWGCRCRICVQTHSDGCKEYGKKRHETDPEGVKERRREWVRANWPKVRKSNDRRLAQYQGMTRARAARHGQEWTSRELDIVGQKALTVKEVALMLGRSYQAVRTQRTRMFADTDRESTPEVRTHGLGGYGLGCRCEVCVEAKREYAEQYRKTHQHKTQAETIKRAGNRGKQWTGAELEVAARDDLSVKEIARRLGRSYYAVNVIRHKIKHDPKTVNFAGISRDSAERKREPTVGPLANTTKET